MIAYDRFGSGEPLILVHPLGSHRQVWSPIIDRLASKREVITFDLPGFGASPPLPTGSPSTVVALVDAVEGFVRDLALDRPHVAGSSLGGAVALELARRGAVRSATAIAPAGFYSRGEAIYLGISLRASRRLGRLLRPVAPYVRSLFFLPFFARPWRITKADAASAVAAFLDAPAYDETLRDILLYRFGDGRTVRVPVTIAWGTRDRLLLPRQAARARAALPAARHVWLEGAGHVPMIDDPQAVAAVVLEGSAVIGGDSEPAFERAVAPTEENDALRSLRTELR